MLFKGVKFTVKKKHNTFRNMKSDIIQEEWYVENNYKSDREQCVISLDLMLPDHENNGPHDMHYYMR